MTCSSCLWQVAVHAYSHQTRMATRWQPPASRILAAADTRSAVKVMVHVSAGPQALTWACLARLLLLWAETLL